MGSLEETSDAHTKAIVELDVRLTVESVVYLTHSTDLYPIWIMNACVLISKFAVAFFLCFLGVRVHHQQSINDVYLKISFSAHFAKFLFTLLPKQWHIATLFIHRGDIRATMNFFVFTELTQYHRYQYVCSSHTSRSYNIMHWLTSECDFIQVIRFLSILDKRRRRRTVHSLVWFTLQLDVSLKF